MKDVYKQKVYDTLDSISHRVKVISEMLDGERPANQEDAKKYIKEIKQGLEHIHEIMDIS
jgi:hypothetical protein